MLFGYGRCRMMDYSFEFVVVAWHGQKQAIPNNRLEFAPEDPHEVESVSQPATVKFRRRSRFLVFFPG